MHDAQQPGLRISIVVAVADNGVIGRDNQLPWHLPADLARFKRLTMGKSLVMGRRTYASIGRPLPGRTSIVLSRTPARPGSAVRWVGSWDEALQVAASLGPWAAVIGGRAVFERALPVAELLHRTRVHTEAAGNVLFPPVDWSRWELIERQERDADARNPLRLTFETYRAIGVDPRVPPEPHPGGAD